MITLEPHPVNNVLRSVIHYFHTTLMVLGGAAWKNTSTKVRCTTAGVSTRASTRTGARASVNGRKVARVGIKIWVNHILIVITNHTVIIMNTTVSLLHCWVMRGWVNGYSPGTGTGTGTRPSPCSCAINTRT